jgi:hypothetical protein
MQQDYARFVDTGDANDNEPWSLTDDDDLIEAVSAGATLDEVASFLCRSGNLLDVAKRAMALGLKWRHCVH